MNLFVEFLVLFIFSSKIWLYFNTKRIPRIIIRLQSQSISPSLWKSQRINRHMQFFVRSQTPFMPFSMYVRVFVCIDFTFATAHRVWFHYKIELFGNHWCCGYFALCIRGLIFCIDWWGGRRQQWSHLV